MKNNIDRKSKVEILKALLSGNHEAASRLITANAPWVTYSTIEGSDEVEYRGKRYNAAEWIGLYAKLKKKYNIIHTHLVLTTEGAEESIQSERKV
jgi:hypothetical protein